MGVKLFAPKSGNRCHFWAAVGPAKVKSKFKVVIVKIFSLKQKPNQILSAAIEKIFFFLFEKTINGFFRQGITVEKYKAKAIQAYLIIFTHMLAYSGIFRTLCNSCVFWTLNTCLIFTPEIFIRCKKVWGAREPGAVNFWYTYLLMYSKKLAYLQLITVLVYRSSPYEKSHDQS